MEGSLRVTHSMQLEWLFLLLMAPIELFCVDLFFHYRSIELSSTHTDAGWGKGGGKMQTGQLEQPEFVLCCQFSFFFFLSQQTLFLLFASFSHAVINNPTLTTEITKFVL